MISYVVFAHNLEVGIEELAAFGFEKGEALGEVEVGGHKRLFYLKIASYYIIILSFLLWQHKNERQEKCLTAECFLSFFFTVVR
jgi:hypothetical protein